MQELHNMGYRIEPWGLPEATGYGVEQKPQHHVLIFSKRRSESTQSKPSNTCPWQVAQKATTVRCIESHWEVQWNQEGALTWQKQFLSHKQVQGQIGKVQQITFRNHWSWISTISTSNLLKKLRNWLVINQDGIQILSTNLGTEIIWKHGDC